MSDKFTVRVVVVGLAAIILACIVAAVVLALGDKDFPEFLKYVGTTALGAFGGILAKTSTDPQPVQVVDQPVATQEVPAQPKRRKRGDVGEISAVLLVIIVIIAAVVLGVGVSHWFWLLLLLLLLALVL